MSRSATTGLGPTEVVDHDRNVNSTPAGGDIVRFAGRAEILDGYPPAAEVPDYLGKYRCAVTP